MSRCTYSMNRLSLPSRTLDSEKYLSGSARNVLESGVSHTTSKTYCLSFLAFSHVFLTILTIMFLSHAVLVLALARFSERPHLPSAQTLTWGLICIWASRDLSSAGIRMTRVSLAVGLPPIMVWSCAIEMVPWILFALATAATSASTLALRWRAWILSKNSVDGTDVMGSLVIWEAMLTSNFSRSPRGLYAAAFTWLAWACSRCCAARRSLVIMAALASADTVLAGWPSKSDMSDSA